MIKTTTKLNKLFVVSLLLFSITCISQENQGFNIKRKSGITGPGPSSTRTLGGSTTINTQTNLLRHPDLGLISVEMNRDMETGIPLFVRAYPKPIQVDLESHEGRARAADQFLNNIGAFNELLVGKYAYSILEENRDNYGNHHLRVSWYYDEVEMYGADMTIHLNQDHFSLNTRMFRVSDLSVANNLIAEDVAIARCKGDLISRGGFKEFGDKENEYYPQGQFQTELVWHQNPEDSRVYLAYHISARPNFLKHREYFVDAQSGEIVFTYDHTCNIGPVTATATDLNGVNRTINTFEGNNNNQFFMFDASRAMYSNPQNTVPEEGDGVIVTLDMNNSGVSNPSFDEITSSNNTWNQAVAVSAHFNSGEAYEYWRQTHGRNSINGQGGDIVSFVNVADDDGSSLENAFWNGQYMFYGNGGQAFSPLAGALDVAGHEMSHGVIQNTANLEYYSESGAINESMADIFGAMIDRDDWQMGEDITNPNFFPTGALRDLSNPHNGGTSLNDIGSGYQPQTVSEMFTGSEDNAGVHINSGIPNYAYYLIAIEIGKDAAERIYYQALTQYLTKSSRFVDLRAAVEMATGDVFPGGNAELAAVQNAFAEVGIGGGGSTGGVVFQEDLTENDGDEFVIAHNLISSTADELELIDLQEQTLQTISFTDVLRRPSITDDGKWLYFLNADKRLRRINMETLEEDDVFPEFVFDNVAVSKDGTKLAAIRTVAEPAIWFHVIGTTGENAWVRANLSNPTFSDGVTTGEVQFADALEWDLAGENLLYDAFNSVTNLSGEDRSYWDVGIINVWDNSTNNWAEGRIEKVFSSLPVGISIGNASYAKNSPFIIAFDFLDEMAMDGFQTFTEYLVAGANLETGEANLIFENNTLGFPNYSVDDSQLLFTTESGDSRSIGIISIADDKISPIGEATEFLAAAEWPLWYANGERDLNVGIEFGPTELDLDYVVAPVPFSESISVYVEAAERTNNYRVIDLTGRTLAEGEIQDNLSINTKNWSAGVYTLLIYNEEGLSSRKLLKVNK